MLDMFQHISLSTVFDWIINTSIMASILVALILSIKIVLRNKLTARWHYIMWFILIVRLILPWSPDSSYSIYSLLLTDFEPSYSMLQPTSEAIAPNKEIGETALNITENNEQPNLDAKDSANHVRQPAKESKSLYEILSYIWLVGAICFALITITVNKNLTLYLQKQRPITDKRVLDILNRCKREMNIQKQIPLLFAGKLSSPTLVGIRNPKILLTENQISTLDDNQLRFIFYHELAHYKRKDVRINWIMHHLLILHWFNPILWYASKCMREDQEIACDALALTYVISGDKLEYGLTIIALLEHHSNLYPMPGVANLSKNKKTIKRRILMIKKFNKKSYRWSALGMAVVIGVSAFSLINAKAEKPDTGTIQNVSTKTVQENKQFDKITSYFATTQVLPEWVKRSAKEGLTTPVNENISDKGITISFDELYTEKSRLYLHFRVENEDGSLVPYKVKKLKNQKQLDFISNNKLDSLVNELKNEDSPRHQFALSNDDVLQLVDFNTEDVLYRMTDESEGFIQISGDKSYELPDSIKIKLQIDRIGETKGNWNREFEIKIDKEKATKSTEIMKEESQKRGTKG
ncbi:MULTISPECIES: M56 family metallopeptidase [unclassified Bacillus (in: firmicutes)]|uniref:M56 family metallopeptidase n=1 Tax=unclassified Bacillus (in: firmicutes) TaxID=185979 RepID=UPI0016189EFE|nr:MULTISPECIES: M56 family metallopeptidase [unclassified Bacillus (in: firmicutes)]